MVVFECAGCGAALTAALTQVDRPDHEGIEWGNSTSFTPPLLADGTYAAQGDFLVAPGDVRGLSWIGYEGYCCGVNASAEPNLACACGRPVATRVDDCSFWQVVEFAPGAVRPVGSPEPVRPWEDFDWNGPSPEDGDLWWERRVEIAAGVAAGRVLRAAEGAPVSVPDGPLAAVFRRAFDEWRPPGGAPKSLALAGPGVTGEADLLLVPRHPQTGQAWPGGSVAVSAELWVLLARDVRPVLPRTGGQWADSLRDVPMPPRPHDVVPAHWAIRRVLREQR
ncbi:hypothetical protein [Lentzea sp. NBRC 102530]|uniref:hypothetical protein n=1 Tax=Lentzea sp. NBRC 102530 TaxID=3032201 RepID=UPI0024A1A43C|nr:hypothetical protein [Lentzea sp. NBRC 102530]GLY47276.1 hypothetical protein Lesp01_09320 [Lentzea sp. NBRC 102530]